MLELLGLSMFAGQVIGTVIVFGGWKDCPKWLKITSGVLQILFFLGALGLAME